MIARFAKIIAICILACLGILLLDWAKPDNDINPWHAMAMLLAGTIAWTPFVYRRLQVVHDYLERLKCQGYGVFLAITAVALLTYFLSMADIAGRPLYPRFHDEHMYLLQARMMAEGHLALPEHACADFFDTFYVIVKPVYSSMYFPGTALAYVLPLWLKLPWHLWPLLITTALMLMTLVVAARLLASRLLGLVAMLGMLGIQAMGYLPTMTMSHTLAALLGVGMTYAWLRWRDQKQAGWAILCGTLAGWMVVTRPTEGLAFSAPIFIAVLSAIRVSNWRTILIHGFMAVLAAVPFLILLGAHNRAVTGSVLHLPINFYVEQEFIGLAAGSGLQNPSTRTSTHSELAQKQVMFDTFVGPMNTVHARDTLDEWAKWRLGDILQYGLPSPLLYLLLFVGLLSISRGPYRVVYGIAIAYVVVYMRYPVYLAQYSVQISPVLMILCLMSSTALSDLWPKQARQIRASYFLAFAVVSLLVISQLGQVGLRGRELGVLEAVHLKFPQNIQGDALVLIKYDKRESPHVEPVYNLERANIDDNRIVLAHDLGEQKNRKIIEYYAAHQPGRMLYYFDRSSLTLISHGTVQEAAAALVKTRSGD